MKKAKLNIFSLLLLLALLVYNLYFVQEESYEDPWPITAEQDLIAPGPFPYIINEETKCAEGSPPFLVLLIATEAHSVDSRNAIRMTWGNENLVPGLALVRLFLLGKRGEDLEQQARLQSESQKYHDIIQQDFVDSYNNLTLKTLMGINWVAAFCPQARYVMKTDSDIFVNTELIIKEVLRPDVPPKSNFYTGLVWTNGSPIRNPMSKWFMPAEIYPGRRYPPFCPGSGYIFSGNLSRSVYNVALKTSYLQLEDVFTGICMSKIGVRPSRPPKGLVFVALKNQLLQRCAYRTVLTSHGYNANDMHRYWKKLHGNKYPDCEKKWQKSRA